MGSSVLTTAAGPASVLSSAPSFAGRVLSTPTMTADTASGSVAIQPAPSPVTPNTRCVPEYSHVRYSSPSSGSGVLASTPIVASVLPVPLPWS